jgi:hypothetical protein
LLGRVVDIGVGLFAMACTCSRARHMAEKGKQSTAVDLADQFCRDTRETLKQRFAGLWRNDDKRRYSLARRVLEGEFAWAEEGVMPIEDFKG